MRALDLMLGERSPTYVNSDNITDDDFFTYQGKSADEIYIWLELDREKSPKEEFDYDTLYGAFGYYVHTKYQRSKETERVPVSNDRASYKSIFDIDPDAEDTHTYYVSTKLKNQGNIEDQIEDKYKFAFAFLAKKDSNGKISKEMRLLYRENDSEEEEGWVLAFRDSIRTELLQSAIVPAFRDPATQLKLNNWSWFGKLMKSLTDSHTDNKKLKDALQNVKEVSDTIFSEVQNTITTSSIDVAFPGAKISFQFSGDANKELYKSARIFVDDGFKSELQRKGTGIQSATIIGLFNYYVNVVSARAGSLLCVEEPELYLHPHAKRVISDRLDDFIEAKKGFKNQVVVTTHSTEFIRSQSGQINIIRICRNGENTDKWEINQSQTRKFVINPEQAELVFADKVIICEGYDKSLIDCVGDKLTPQQLDSSNISVIKTNSKDQIASTVRFALGLGIKPIVLCDFDYLLRDKTDDRKKYDQKAHDSVEQLRDCCVKLGDTKNTICNKVATLRADIKANHEELFYTAKCIDDFTDETIKQRLVEVIEDFRKLGIFILTGEIEYLFTDRKLLDDKKCTDKTIRKLRELSSDDVKKAVDTDLISQCTAFALSAT